MKLTKSKPFLKKIQSSNVYDVAMVTPLTQASKLSKELDNNILLKREDLQPVFSFKLRGAYNKLSRLKKKGSNKKVIAASAGNHAQGVAYASNKLGIRSTIVMPLTTPSIKIDSVKNYGARVLLYGDNFDEAFAYAKNLSLEKKEEFIHPYDDPDVIAGQGTIGMEILEVLPTLDAIFVPVGGGGLIAGIGAYIKSLRPDIKVIAVEPVDAACLQLALSAKKRLALKEVGLFAAGVAVRQIGKLTYGLINEWIDEVVTVSVDEICAAVQDTFEATRTIPEPAGALSLAGLKKLTLQRGWKNKFLVAINSGANINFDRLSHIVERVQLGEKKEALISIKIPEKRGSFRRFCKSLEKRMITEFNYRADDEVSANIFVACKINGGSSEKKSLIKGLKSKGYSPIDLSENEVAKIHIKHMVGGKAPKHITEYGELVFRVEFPEKPGALLNFLSTLGDEWNITLFHYRNQGAAYGRVLVGFQAKENERYKLIKKLKEINFPFWDESENKAYLSFLN